MPRVRRADRKAAYRSLVYHREYHRSEEFDPQNSVKVVAVKVKELEVVGEIEKNKKKENGEGEEGIDEMVVKEKWIEKVYRYTGRKRRIGEKRDYAEWPFFPTEGSGLQLRSSQKASQLISSWVCLNLAKT
ncbi:hypothetical protein G5I_11344 [Acromyrmex echinatior]|uniref:Uncharacterized protein n=1 Tax=Acromyrmex echinatior TaxID=103372 RepID=F4WZC6_ACREC|nr:hypothetical protein G5I_11344 [Acromyrmex echinatior]